MRKNLSELGPCGRCKKGTFRERLPIVTIVQRYRPKLGELEAAWRGTATGQVMGFPIALTNAMLPTLVEFEHVEAEDQTLCFRCSGALVHFLDNLTEDEIEFYAEMEEAGLS